METTYKYSPRGEVVKKVELVDNDESIVTEFHPRGRTLNIHFLKTNQAILPKQRVMNILFLGKFNSDVI